MRKIPGIYVEIKGDSTQLRKDIRQARDIVTEQAKGMSNALNNALSPTQIKKNLNSLITDLGTLSRASQVTGKTFSQIGVDLGHLQRVTGITDTEFAKLQTRMLNTQAAKNQEKALRDIARTAGLTEKEIRALGMQMGLSKTQIGNVTGVAKDVGRSFELLGTAARAAMAYFSVAAMAGFAKAVFDVGTNLDSLQRSFTAITGSAAGMKEEFSFLRETAERTGQNFYNLTEGYKTLLAASRETQLEGEQTRKIFSAMSEAAAVLGMSTEGVDRSFKALGQMMSKGTVQAEELKGQLGDHLPGALQIAARAMDMSTKQLMKMMESGDVLATELLPKLADELHRMYGEAAKTAGLESSRAAVNRLSMAWTDLKANLYDSETAVSIINKLAGAVEAINENKPGNMWDQFRRGVESTIPVVGTLLSVADQVNDKFNNESVTAADNFTSAWKTAEEKSMREYKQWANGQKLAVSQAYEQAYSVIGGMSQDVYDKMKQKYVEDRDAFIKLTGDKATAYAVFSEKMKNLDQQKAGKTGTSRASDYNAALQAELEYLKASEEKRLSIVKAANALELQDNQRAYDLGLASYRQYLDKKLALTLEDLQANLEAKEKEQAAAQAALDNLKPITDKEGNARPDKNEKARYDALKKVEDATRDVTKAQNELDLAIAQGAHESVQANKASGRSFQELNVQLLEMRGQHEAAALARAQYDREGAEYRRLEMAALAGEISAKKELEALEAIWAHQREEKTLNKAIAAKQAEIDLANLNGEHQKELELQQQLLAIEIKLAELRGESPQQIAYYKAMNVELKKMETAAGAFAKGWKDATKGWANEAKRMENLAQDVAYTMHSSFEDLFFDALQGDMKSFMDYFKGFLTSLNRSLAKFWADWLVGSMTNSSSGGGGGWLTWITKLFSSGAGAASGGTSVGAAEGWHSGGVLGKDAPSFTRSVPASLYNNAPRYHNGLMPDEYPAILKRGESVFTPGQLEALHNHMVGRYNGRSDEKRGDSISISVPVSVQDKSKKWSTELKHEIEDTVERYLRRHAA